LSPATSNDQVVSSSSISSATSCQHFQTTCPTTHCGRAR
jgi:hypothetical protein